MEGESCLLEEGEATPMVYRGMEGKSYKFHEEGEATYGLPTKEKPLALHGR